MNGRAAACVLTIVTPEKWPGNMPAALVCADKGARRGSPLTPVERPG